jgi:hypothetical protein
MGLVHEKRTFPIRETAMQEALNSAQEAEARELAEAIAAAAAAEFLQLARELVASGSSPFGKAEFTIRDIVLRVGAKAYEQHLAKKTMMANLGGELVLPLVSRAEAERFPLETGQSNGNGDPLHPGLPS